MVSIKWSVLLNAIIHMSRLVLYLITWLTCHLCHLQGMGYLHARGIIHKDLKTKNIFLENGKVVITDFGLFSVTKICHGNRYLKFKLNFFSLHEYKANYSDEDTYCQRLTHYYIQGYFRPIYFRPIYFCPFTLVNGYVPPRHICVKKI